MTDPALARAADDRPGAGPRRRAIVTDLNENARDSCSPGLFCRVHFKIGSHSMLLANVARAFRLNYRHD